MKNKYTTNPKEIYELELKKLQFCFSELQQLGGDASELARINWRHVEHLRHVNFILQEAALTGKAMLNLPLTN